MSAKTRLALTTPYDEAVEKFLGDIGSPKTQIAYGTGAKVFREFLKTQHDGVLTLEIINDGDLLIEFGGMMIDNLYDFTYALRAHKPGDVVQVIVKRHGEDVHAKVTLEARK